MNNQQSNAMLLGIGLDNEDGHKRFTHSEQFCIAGGSEETHERLTETALKTMEELASRGTRLEEVESRELEDIILKNTPA